MAMAQIRSLLVASAAAVLVSACGADEIASPGTGGNITINNGGGSTGGGSTGGGTTGGGTTTLVTPAAGCPTIADPQQLRDDGTITGPTGTWRVCSLPARINASITLPKIAGLLYQLPGRVDVGTDLGAATAAGAPAAVTLTIAPGVIVYGGTGVSWLAVNRGNRINATGTATQPIIFTSRDNVLGLNTDQSSGQWGGVVLMGRAPITDCRVAGATPGTAACDRQTEGASDPALYGGATPTDNSGTMRYVQIRYSGYVLSGNSELQSLTPSGVGSGTTLEYIQSHNSSDDGVEYFGGVNKTKYLVVTGAEDDGVDTDTGLKATFQYVLAIQRGGSNIGDSSIEVDTTNTLVENTPRQNTKIANFTFIQRSTSGSNGVAMRIRGGSDYALINGLVQSPDLPCLRVDDPETIRAANPALDDAGPVIFASVNMACGGTDPIRGGNGNTNAQIVSLFTGGPNNNSTFTFSLSNVFVNGANETGRTAVDPKTYDAAFDTTNYVGAVKDAADTWYRGWTCDSVTATFNTTASLCTSLPTT